MSTIHIENENQLFLELATRLNQLSAAAVSFCQEKMNFGVSPAVAAVQEGFLTKEQVAEIYRVLYQEHGNQDVPVCVVSVAGGSHDDFESKFLELAKDRVTEHMLSFCRREQERLARMGYQVQLPAVLWGTGSLSSEQILAMYQEILGADTKINMIKGQLAFADFGLPAMRKLPDARKIKAKTAPESVMMEQLQEVVQVIEQKQHPAPAKSKAAAPPEVEIPVEVETLTTVSPKEMATPAPSEPQPAPVLPASSPPSAPAEVKAALPQATVAPAPIESPAAVAALAAANAQVTLPVLNQILEALQQLAQSSMVVTASESPSGQETPGAEDMERELAQKEDAAEEDRELQLLKRGKQTVSPAQAIKILQKTGKLENCYISALKLNQAEFANKIIFSNCLLENLEIANSVFAENVDFSGSNFVGKAVFKGTTFRKEAKFNKAVFMDGADFSRTEFQGDARFNTAGFKRFVNFNRSNFGQKAIFSRCYFAKGAKFTEVEFASGASFNDSYCDHRFYMDKCKFRAETTFSNARFSDIADFSKSLFAKVVKFKGTHFSKWASYRSVKFQDECHFNGANIAGDLSFEWATFQGIINLRTLCAERNVNFSNAKVESGATFSLLDAYFGRLFLTRKQLEGRLDSHIQQDYQTARQEYGLLKNNFREINEYEREDWAYLMEKRMERRGIKVKGIGSALNRFFNWLALDKACGYGTRPLNIFTTSLFILVLFAGFYYAFGSHFHLPDTPGKLARLPLLEAFLVSFRTFTNAAVGGWLPNQTSWMNYVMMLESFFGLFVITVLVVTFSRKVIR